MDATDYAIQVAKVFDNTIQIQVASVVPVTGFELLSSIVCIDLEFIHVSCFKSFVKKHGILFLIFILIISTLEVSVHISRGKSVISIFNLMSRLIEY